MSAMEFGQPIGEHSPPAAFLLRLPLKIHADAVSSYFEEAAAKEDGYSPWRVGSCGLDGAGFLAQSPVSSVKPR
jgi:hypothetical protein